MSCAVWSSSLQLSRRRRSTSAWHAPTLLLGLCHCPHTVLVGPQLISAPCASFVSTKATPSVLAYPLVRCLSTLLTTVSVVLTVSIWSHRDLAGLSCSSSSLLPLVLPPLLRTLCGCSQWQSWLLSWMSEGVWALQLPSGFHYNASYSEVVALPHPSLAAVSSSSMFL